MIFVGKRKEVTVTLTPIFKKTNKTVTKKISLLGKIMFPRQSLKIFTFRVKLSDSIFFLLGHSPIVKLI